MREFEMTLEKAVLLCDGYVDGMEDVEPPRLPDVPHPPKVTEVPVAKPLAKVIGSGVVHKKAAPVATSKVPRAKADALHRRAVQELTLKILALTGGTLPEGATMEVKDNVLTITHGVLKVVVKEYADAKEAARLALKQMEGKLRHLYATEDLPLTAEVKLMDGGKVVIRYGRLREEFVDAALKAKQEADKQEAKRQKMLLQNLENGSKVIAPPPPNPTFVRVDVSQLSGQMKPVPPKQKEESKKKGKKNKNK